jgi:hypothetical protein
MTMLAEVVDAVIGIDTHRDSHEVEIADAAGRPITGDADRQRWRRVRSVAGDHRRAGAWARIRNCPRTRAYIDRRTTEGKTPREIRRCLKRYIARELYKHLTHAMTSPTGP